MWGLIRGGRKNFFFEKKEKLLDIGAAPVRPDRLQTNKSFFGSFFQKRTAFLPNARASDR
jgi:hypothetical protein